jgi:hypothetical protein
VKCGESLRHVEHRTFAEMHSVMQGGGNAQAKLESRSRFIDLEFAS